MSELVTAQTLQRDLLEAGRNLRGAIDEAREASAEYVRAKYTYQLAWDKAFLAADGTEQRKKSQANIETHELAKLHDLALERKRIGRLNIEGWQSIVSAFQTIGSTARAEMRLGG